jgi:hypothetical protein
VAVVTDPEKNRMIDFPDITSPVEGLKRIAEAQQSA